MNQLPESGRYVIFGKVTQGMDVVDQICSRAGQPADRRRTRPLS